MGWDSLQFFIFVSFMIFMMIVIIHVIIASQNDHDSHIKMIVKPHHH
jgi:hypothetical protein